MTRPRAVPAPAPVEIDEVAQAARYRSLSIWCQLHIAGQGVQLVHSGSLSARLAHLEAQIDANGIRVQADRHLASLERGAERTHKHIETLKQQGYGPA
jgi:hypothetical protein